MVELLRDGVKNAEVMAAALAQIQEAMESGRPKVIIIRNRIDRP